MTGPGSAAVAGGFGAGLGTGLVLLACSVHARATGLRLRVRAAATRAGDAASRPRRGLALRAGAAGGAAVLVTAVTGWIAGGVLAGAAAWFLPALIGPDRVSGRRIARAEAIASWTEMLRDVLSSAAGLEQAVTATAALAPAPVRREVLALTARLHSGQRLPAALRRLAGELADPTADLVLAALVLASQQPTRRLADLLGSLAAAARQHVAMRLRVDAGRARTRTSARVIAATTLAFAAGVVAFDRGYLEPYDTPAGQAILAAVGCLFAAGFAWLSKITAGTGTARVLTLEPTPAADSAPRGGGARP
ncbi:type II secretion system F family protein [Amycolatopsis benzoatilytica]|uniref:type II secretion system F family protein n=1 Tax=Amycolatopsis benzoatilytica TaxID=346045 RepID=UPI00039B1004|nr:type II secretion system F family protein [Amycolatopsis benzoatilytica]